MGVVCRCTWEGENPQCGLHVPFYLGRGKSLHSVFSVGACF